MGVRSRVADMRKMRQSRVKSRNSHDTVTDTVTDKVTDTVTDTVKTR